MGVTVLAGTAYISATPSSQVAQVLRATATANYTEYTINANSSGSTKYDWIYLNVNATNANAPDAAADNVTAIYTSRSTSNTSDTGSPPTYGLLLAVVTVANGATSITNSNITDKRYNTSIGTQNGSLIVTQQATGDAAIIQAAGQDSNINLELLPKGTGNVQGPGGPVWQYLGYAQVTTNVTTTNTSVTDVTGLSATVTVPTGVTAVRITSFCGTFLKSGSAGDNVYWYIRESSTTLNTVDLNIIGSNYSESVNCSVILTGSNLPSSGTHTYKISTSQATSGTIQVVGSLTAPVYILVECC